MLSFRRHLHISLAQKENVLWGRISGKSVSCFHFPSNPGATDNPGPSATSCSLATRSRGGLVGAAVAVPFHFLPSEGARGVGARWGKEVLGCEEKGGWQLLSSDLQEGLGRTWVSHILGPSQL